MDSTPLRASEPRPLKHTDQGIEVVWQTAAYFNPLRVDKEGSSISYIGGGDGNPHFYLVQVEGLRAQEIYESMRRRATRIVSVMTEFGLDLTEQLHNILSIDEVDAEVNG